MEIPPACDVDECLQAVQAEFAARGASLHLIVDPRVPAFFPCSAIRLGQLLRSLLRGAFAEANSATLIVYEADDPAQCVLRFEIKNTALGFTLSPEHPSFPEDSPHRALAILVAEDNLANQTLVNGYLHRLGCSCDIVDNGLAAVEAARRRAYGLILMDIHMPGMDGIEATRAIRTLPHGGQSFIAALTAYTLPGHRQECLDAGMNDYLSKPCRLESLITVIDKAASRLAARSNF